MNRHLADVIDERSDKDGLIVASPGRDVTTVEGDKDFELHDGIEFESHEAAYSFYQEYAKSMGFTTSIKNSRRSKKSKEFIDAKFACSRYGVTPESDGGSTRRPSVKKTDCKASMHVKRRKDGKWYIHEFIKDHNHELLPALAYHFRIHKNVKLAEKNNMDILHAVSERTKKMYVQMSRQSGGYSSVGSLRDDLNYQFDRGQFDMRWWKLVGRFELQENEWFHSLYEDRKKWVPTYMKDTFLAGMSTPQRAESVNSFFDKYIHKKVTLKEFIRQYGTILQNRYEEEAIADFDTWHKQPALKSPSPWEKQMSSEYTHTIFKKFQVEVLGVVGCHPKREREDGSITIYTVDDCEKAESFMVTWNGMKSEVWCSCLLFEYRGYLCRHAMIVLQICGFSNIPSCYILKRWTKDAKNNQSTTEGMERMQTRVQLYNDLCKHAIQLGEEGSLSEESYDIAFRALVEALKTCVNVNNKECSNNALSIRDVEEENLGAVSAKTSKRKSANKKRKVQSEPEPVMLEVRDNLQQMESMSSDGITLHGYYGTQQNVQGLGLVYMNSIWYTFILFKGNMCENTFKGQLNSLAPTHDGFFEAQQSIHGLGHLDFRPPSFGYGMQDEASLRTNQMHNRHS
ncbi:FAR1 DNA binding domain-containing protein [Cynara cardunculus var. scolymus]|uniref:Protein FAR1-RELATED SEQUENCE n=1 Tax=Cynara cardunculus var. scolymus TaxID=59895 RepID=A0A118JXU5_CYNCS|nr:FAR1 DNA binding domain-containing protein [Cynara cardunculus var. scolymus]